MKFTNENIVTDHNPLIREVSEEVKLPLSNEDKEILNGLYTYVKNSTDEEIAKRDNLSPAVGLAAIQVGIKKKMLAVVVDQYDKNDNLIKYQFALANPKIVSSSVQKACLKNGEGCLSVPVLHQGHVYRSARIRVKAYDLLQDKIVTIRARGYLAIVLQHEIDHLSGKLYYDYINKKDPDYILPDAEIIG